MYMLLCEEYGILSVISFVKAILEVISIAVPIALIIMMAIEISKVVFNPDAKVIKKTISSVVAKSIATVAVFFVPLLVNLVMGMLGMANVEESTCWINANTTYLRELKEANKLKEAEEAKKNAEIKRQAKEERERINAHREQLRKEAFENAKGGSGAKLVEVAQNEYNSYASSNHVAGRPNKYTRGYGAIGGSYSYEWCAAFVWWVSNEAGVYPKKVTYKTAGVQQYINYFKNNNDGNHYESSKAYGGNYTPKAGDYIFANYGGHIGIVKGVNGNQVLYLHGNCGNDRVCDSGLNMNDAEIVGYGVWS